ncbi:Type I Iterative PKS [Diplodia intermedia]|uniref:Type I Iterative PKS n=1 Tax=Diplodia intermedia TaxID=856260 RepID=A0ABR3TII0_9PEZI
MAVSDAENARPDDVAIVGLAFRGPGDASSPERLWDMLVHSRPAFSSVPRSKWSHEGHYHPSPARGGSTSVNGGHFLDTTQDGTRFDAAFFDMRRPEVLSMDLQQRIALESVYEAVENAGLTLEKVRGSKTSVFAAATNDDTRAILGMDPDFALEHKHTGTSKSIIANRVSWFYDFRGCSMTLDTACSSSLVALHTACGDLRQGQSTMSIVCGVNVIENPESMYGMDRDQKAQEELIRQVYDSAKLDLNTTAFVEAHGVGSPTADVEEARAIAGVWKDRPEPLYVGAAKANHGHLEGASGVASIIKVVLALERGIIPPNINFEKAHPEIDTEAWNIKFPLTATSWPPECVRRASVNSFGFGGTNAHVVLDDAYSYLRERQLRGIHRTEISESRRTSTSGDLEDRPKYRIFTWSAKDQDGINRCLSAYSHHLASLSTDRPHAYLSDLAHTLAERRCRFPWSFAVAAESVEELTEAISNRSGVARPMETPSIGFLFTGQGAQWYAMGRELLAYPVFKETVELASDFIASLRCPWSVFDELLKSEEESRIDEPYIAQTLCTVIQIALVDLLSSWGITPAYVLGHSTGEPAAAYCAGALDQRSALRISYYRGMIASRPASTKGSMLAALWASASDANSSRYRSLVGDLSVGSLVGGKDVQIFSSITGQKIDVAEMSRPDYWIEALQATSKFDDALQSLCSTLVNENSASSKLIEIGPTSTFSNSLEDAAADEPAFDKIGYQTVLLKHRHATATLLSTVATLFVDGHPVDLHRINHGDEDPELLVDLPPYAFDRSLESWCESRRSQVWRFRKWPRHDILGSPVPDWNENEPQWRNCIRLSELPWLKDYKITGHVVFPGVSFLNMAIEGVTQLASGKGDIAGFDLRNVVISHALLLEEDHETEVMLSMRKSSLGVDSAWDFSVFGYKQDTWLECCRGSVAVEFAFTTGPVDAGREVAEHKKHFREILEQCEVACQSKRDLRRQYAELERVGLEFGPLFQNLTEVKCGDDDGPTGQAIATLRIPNVASCMPCNYLQPHFIQSATLDSLTHMIPFALQGAAGAGNLREPSVPIALKSLWISGRTETEPGHVFTCQSSARPSSHNKFSAEITMWDEASREARVIIRGLEIGPLQELALREAGQRQLCFKVNWKPDIDLLGEEVQNCFRESLKSLEEEDSTNLKRIQDLQLAAAIYILEAVEHFDDESNEPKELAPHKQKYLDWLRMQARNYEKERIGHQLEEWDDIRKDTTRRDAFLRNLEDSGPEGKLTVRMGSHIIPTLKAEQDALHLVFMDSLLEEYYSHMVGTDKVHALLSAYLDLYSHKNRDLRVCEVGAGTGGATASLLEAFCPNGLRGKRSTRLRKYTFTDISSGSFEKAQVKFTKWREVLEFKALDIEKDLTGQGFEEVEGTYDVVIAANVLHATADLSLAMENIYRLLKPGGKLIIQEFTQPDFLPGPLSFGLLPNWWRSTEPSRQWGPLLTEKGWVAALREHGFEKSVLRLPDTLNPDLHVQSIIVATTQEEEKPQADIDIKRTFVVTSGRPVLREQLVADNLAAQLMTMYAGKLDLKVRSLTSLEEHSLKDSCCIVTVELGNALLAGDIGSEEWTAMRKLLTTANGVIWTTMDPFENPKVGLSTGLLRTLRWERERDGCDLTTVAFEDSEKNESEMARHIRRIYRRHFVEGRDKNAEYLVRGNLVRTNRLVEAAYANDFISASCAKPVPQPQTFGADKSRALKLSIATPGQFDSLRFVDDPELANPLPENYIEVEIKAAGLNYRDVLAAKGEIPANVLGTEGAGFVTRVGPHVTDIELGDRVIVLSAECGTFQTYARAPRDAAIKIPEGMDFTVAAGLPVAFSLAYYSLVEVGRLKKRETCLIHAAAGGVGQAAIQIAKSQGAEIFATVSSEEKRDLLIEVYGIPKDQILSSRDLSFAKGIKRLTQDRGVDVVLNCLSGEALRRSWDCIAPFGRFVEIGNRDVFANANLNMEPFRRSATFAAVDLHSLLKLDLKTTARVLNHVMELWQQEEIKAATPTTVYNYSQIEEAFSLLQQGGHIGKVVLTANEDDVVNVVPKPRASIKLREDASYVLSGGFGGLCRSVAKSMALQGAQNLIFLSRSGASSDAAQELIEDLKRMGIRCEVFKCDVSDDGVLLAALRSCEESGMPKIAGVIQGATQLKDSAFDSMSLEDYQAALTPKVRGSWNLHEYLPKDLDFFIMLSSSNAVVGAKHQANHASANSYQDALAHYRRARGLPATTLDLGNVFSAGSTATNRETLNPSPLLFFEDDDSGIQEQQFLALIEYHVDRQRATAPTVEPQIAVGLPCAADFRSRSVPEPAFLKTPLFMHLRSGAAIDDLNKSDEETENNGIEEKCSC